MNKWLSVEEASLFLGRGQNTIISWCKSKKLSGSVPIAYGTKTRWMIPSPSVLALAELDKHRTKKGSNRSQAEFLTLYDRYCEQGLISGRPYSPATRKIIQAYLRYFLEKHKEVNFLNLKSELLEIPIEHFAKRYKLWEVCWNFMKWLITEEYETDTTQADKIHKLRPKRHLPAKRHVLREDEIDRLEDACRTSFEKVIVVLLSQTGIRATEFCSLTMENIDLEHRELDFVGKGGKSRKVGLTNKAHGVLKDYLTVFPPVNVQDPVFKDKAGKPLVRYGLYSRLKTIADRVGIKAHPHCLRRSFVTVNVKKGKNLVHLQLLCGHSSIETTRGYCMTDQQEAVDMVKDW